MKLKSQIILVLILSVSSIYSQEIDCYSVELTSGIINQDHTVLETYCNDKIISKTTNSSIAPFDSLRQNVKKEKQFFVYNSNSCLSQILTMNLIDDKPVSVDTINIKYNFETQIDSISNYISKIELSQILNYLTLQRSIRNKYLSILNNHNTVNWTYELSTNKDTIELNLSFIQNERYVTLRHTSIYKKPNDNSIYIQEIRNNEILINGYKRFDHSLKIVLNEMFKLETITKIREKELITYSYDSEGRINEIRNNLNSHNDIEYTVIEEE